jgi:eukaryotic-like serine/threonine-protein kinase
MENSTVVYAVAWSPDGRRIASGSQDHTVQVWDAQSGKTLLIYRGHTDFVNAVAWSPDSQAIVSGSDDGTIQVWK